MKRLSLKQILETNVGEGYYCARIKPVNIERIIACPASISSEKGTRKENGALKNTDVISGRILHEYAEYYGKVLLGEMTEEEWSQARFKIRRLNPELDYRLLVDYQKFLRDLKAKNIDFVVEQMVDATSYFPECFGKADLIAYDEKKKTLIVGDLKTGRRQITAKFNPQLMTYAYGAYLKLRKYYDVNFIDFLIFQSQSSNGIRSWEGLSPEQLEEWILGAKNKIIDALSGEGKENPGYNQCRYCPRKDECRAWNEARACVLTINSVDLEEIGAMSSENLVQAYGICKSILALNKPLNEEIKRRCLEGENIDGVFLSNVMVDGFIAGKGDELAEEILKRGGELGNLLAKVPKKYISEYCNSLGIQYGDYYEKKKGPPRLLLT